jgi:surface protein
VSHFDTANVTSFDNLFDGCSKLENIDVSHFNTSKVQVMYGVFRGCSSLTSVDVSGFDTSNVADMLQMFDGCSSLTNLDVSNFNTSNTTRIGFMFGDCSKLTMLDMSHYNTAKVTDMREVFRGCANLKTIYVGEEWSTENVTEGASMFEGCTNLVGGAGTRYDANYVDYTYAHIDGGENNPGYFTDKNAEPWTDLEPYAVLSRNNTVLTFYCDDKMEERGGISVDDDRWESRERELSSSIVALVFDESFSDFVVN